MSDYTPERDDQILGGVLRRFLADGEYRYWFIGEEFLCLDATVSVTEEERAVLMRITEPEESA